MKRLVYALLLVIFAASCGKNGWYINVDNTAWEISTDTQTGWPCFLDDVNVSIIQKKKDNSHFSTLNGTFIVDGHRVDVLADGGSVRMTRTFSHLKNSNNRNYKSLSPLAPHIPHRYHISFCHNVSNFACKFTTFSIIIVCKTRKCYIFRGCFLQNTY